MLKKIIRNPYLYIILITYYCVLLSWDAIKLPFHNPAGIISALPSIGYNPANNILRFLLAVLGPPIACLMVWLLINKKPAKLWKLYARVRFLRIALATVIIAVSILLCVGMGIVEGKTNPTDNPTDTYGGPYSHALVDTFHEGETLGPAISYAQPNLAPYRDFVIVHGVFQDVFRSTIAFSLFGKSIGAVRAFTTILFILTVFAYFILLLILFRGNIYKSVLGLCIPALLMAPSTSLPVISEHIFGLNLPFRDIATIAFLIAAVTGSRFIGGRSKTKLIAASSIVGFIAVGGFANSIDRALFVAVLSIVWLVLSYIMSEPKQFLKTIFLPYLAGAVIAIPLVGIAIKWAFFDFFDYLITISKYKEYLDGIVFARPDSAVTVILLTVTILITIFGAYLFKLVSGSVKKSVGLKTNTSRVIVRLKPIVHEHYIAILLFATGLLFLRSAIGRALPDHWIYSVQWLYLFLAYLGINYLFKKFKDKQIIIQFVVVMLVGSCTLLYAYTVKQTDIRRDAFPIHVQDKDLMKVDYIETSNYLKKNLKDNETFVTLTSEASWYYFVDKPSPIKYPVIWYAFTKSQRDVIAKQLDEGMNIKYVITNNNWTSTFDYVPNDVRFPEVYKVLANRYVPYVGIGQQTIWIRK